jgi:hypothetical protein
MFYTTVVKVVSEGSSQPLAGVQVQLYDKDMLSKDDLLGAEQTNAEGEARFRFNSDQFDDEDQVLRGIFPDLYAVVLAPDGSQVCTTKADTVDNVPRRHITITVPATAAQAHGWQSV